MDTVDMIIRYEQGDMSDDEIPPFFQHLKDTGVLYGLQGHYGRTYMDLKQSGLVD